MGGSHGHVQAEGQADAQLRLPGRMSAVLTTVVVLLAVGVAVSAALLWPTTVRRPAAGTELPPQQQIPAVVQALTVRTCPGISEDRLPDGTIPATVRCGVLELVLKSGAGAGRKIKVNVDEIALGEGVTVGDTVNVTPLPDDTSDSTSSDSTDYTLAATDAATADSWVFVDFNRSAPLIALSVVFVALVVAVARLRGLAALLGLGLGYLTILEFMLPAVRNGHGAAPVTFVGCVGIMIVILYLSHGVSAKTTCALLGTVLGLSVTAGLAWWSVSTAHLNGLTDEDSLTLVRLVGQHALTGTVLAGLILAGLGVLNDVTVTQASAVWELRLHAPDLGPGRLFLSGMRIGRDHLASTVYTIAFAYAGSALPTILLITLYAQPLGQVLTGAQIAEEVARTLVGGIGLILAIPLTTAVAVLVATSAEVEPVRPRGGRRARRRADVRPAVDAW